MITNIANVIAGYLAKRSGKRTARKYERYFKVMRPLNLA
jgi:hypothetical protein